MTRFTLGSNVLVYGIDHGAGARHRIAVEIMRALPGTDCRLTLQAISEFYWATTRKGLLPASEAAAQARDWLALFPSIAADTEAVRTALALAQAGRASYWDALLAATAAEAGCSAILTEDLADGATVAGVRIVNPFGPDGLTEPARALLSPEP